MCDFKIYPLSECAVTLQFSDAINIETHKRIIQFQSGLQKASMPGFLESVPAYTTLTVYYDLLKVDQSSLKGDSIFSKVSNFIQAIEVGAVRENTSTHVVEIPVCYHAELGLDLIELADSKNISPEKIIELHTSKVYTVYMIGFTPGFPYMGEIDDKLTCSRKANPRKKVPAGSVAIAGKQTGIYPFDTPGGWMILGRTPMKLFSPHQNPPALLKAGMNVRFTSISRNEFDSLRS